MVRGETIVAAVHNHTTNNYNNSDGPSDDDWAGAREWVENGLSQAGSYSEYILSPTGSFAEFDYAGSFGRNSSSRSNRRDADSKC